MIALFLACRLSVELLTEDDALPRPVLVVEPAVLRMGDEAGAWGEFTVHNIGTGTLELERVSVDLDLWWTATECEDGTELAGPHEQALPVLPPGCSAIGLVKAGASPPPPHPLDVIQIEAKSGPWRADDSTAEGPLNVRVDFVQEVLVEWEGHPTTTADVGLRDPAPSVVWEWPALVAQTVTFELQNRDDHPVKLLGATSGCAALTLRSEPALGSELAAGVAVAYTFDWLAVAPHSTRCLVEFGLADLPAVKGVVAVTAPASTTAPSVTINGPAPGSWVPANDEVVVTGTVSDDLDFATHLDAELVDGPTGKSFPVSITVDGYVVGRAPAASLGSGAHTLVLSITDHHGRVGRAAVPLVVEDRGADEDDDGDGDGWSQFRGDCEDTRPDIYPYAVETADGLDQDCDGVVDNDTEASDDDADGVSEADGDCDDSNALVGPTGLETANLRDDDCDGVADEGTGLYDDDGDGFAEAAGDLDDDNPDAFPGAIERCRDGIDNDCDGVIDEPSGCLGAGPAWAAAVAVQNDVCTSGSNVEVELLTDSTTAEVSWSCSGCGTFRPVDRTHAAFLCPSVDAARSVALLAAVSEPDGTTTTASGRLVALPADSDIDGPLYPRETDGCGAGAGASAGFGMAAALGIRAGRRRR